MWSNQFYFLEEVASAQGSASFYTWVLTVMLPIILAVLGSSWVGDLIKDYREKKSGKITTNQIMNEIQKLQADVDQNYAIQSRVRILRFNDELLNRTRHSKESFDQTLSDIDTYEKYCHDHEDFVNNKTVLATEHIKKCYAKCEEEGDFL